MKWIFCDPLPWDYDVSAPRTRPMGGSQSALCYLAAALANRGHSVATVTGVSTTRVVGNITCYAQREVPPGLLAADDAITVVLNGPGDIGVDFRRNLSGLRRLVLWTQHAADQPAMRVLLEPANLLAWDRIVCVSEWQRTSFVQQLGVPLARLEVLRNAIAPSFQNLFADEQSLAAAKQGAPQLAYTSTPFRGLAVLVNCFPELKRRHPDCQLHVFSSMKVYGDLAADEHAQLYALCRATEGISYHASLAQPELARELAGISVLAYPNTFPETSCIAVMEALAAGALVVTSDLGALPETTQGYARLVRFHGPTDDRRRFENDFVAEVDEALGEMRLAPDAYYAARFAQSRAVNESCTWDIRAGEWEAFAARWMSDERAAVALDGTSARAPAESAAVHFQRGSLKLRSGNSAEAMVDLRRAVELDPLQAGYWNDLSIAQNRLGRPADSEASARRAIALSPASAAAWLNLANALFAQQRWPEAAEAFQTSLQSDATNPAAWNNFAATLQKLNRLAEAQEAYERSLAIAPGHLGGLANYACLLALRGERERALSLLRGAFESTPRIFDSHMLLGFAFQRLSDLESAEAAYRQAWEMQPRHRDARYNLALVLQQRWSLAEAESLIRSVVEEDPHFADAWALLSNIQQLLYQMTGSSASMRQAVALAPDPHRHSRYLLKAQYGDELTPAELLAAHREWDTRYGSRVAPPNPPGVHMRPAGRRLRIGFVSADFAQHPTGFLVLPAMEQLDKSRCEIVCYTDRLHEDQYTSRFRAVADQWRMTLDRSPADIAQQIRQDEIDVLIDLMGHTGRTELLIFAQRPAPVQITWFGYVGTTGLAAMDYLLADRFHVRPGEEGAYVEKVLRMPNSYACYGPPTETPPVEALPARAAGYVTFGCFNIPAKISTRTLDAWGQILRRVPTARLMLKYGGVDQPEVQARIGHEFASRGVSADRLILEGWSEHPELLAAYQRVDLALDTQPYSGGLTTCEALWMGVPVITYPGQTFAGRHSQSYLANAGLAEFIAADAAEYVELAVNWASRIDELSQLRKELRSRLRESPVCDAQKFAADFLSLLEEVVRSPGRTA